MRPGSVLNAASKLPALLPGGALAPSSIVSIEGIRFYPPGIAVEIQSGGRTLHAAVIHATPEHILVRMPQFRQSGEAKLFVISQGQRSSGSDITLTARAFGIFTANGNGWGPAAALQGPGGTPTPLPIAHPGADATIFGTGIGSSGLGPVQVLVSGIPATRLRRSSANGLDRISFRVPPEVHPGCGVPVIVISGAATSNTATLPVGEHSTCSDARNWFDDLRRPGTKSANILLLRSDIILELTPGKPVPFTLDNLVASLARHLENKATGPFDLMPSPGSCLNWSGPLDSNQLALPSIMGESLDSPDAGPDLGPDIATRAMDVEDLDAGRQILVSGPLGSRRALRAKTKPRAYTAILGGNPPVTRIQPTPLFLASGAYRIESGGGQDTGPFSARVDVREVIQWRNRAAVTTLDRRTGIDLQWTLPAGYTGVAFAWNVSRRNSFGGFTVCMAPIGSDHFRIPAHSVANLPATIVSNSDLSLGFVGVAAVPIDPPSFDAKGLDRARALFASLSGRSVIVK